MKGTWNSRLDGDVQHPWQKRVADDKRHRAAVLGLSGNEIGHRLWPGFVQLGQPTVQISESGIVHIYVIGEEVESKVALAYGSGSSEIGGVVSGLLHHMAYVLGSREGDKKAFGSKALSKPEEGIDMALTWKGDEKDMDRLSSHSLSLSLYLLQTIQDFPSNNPLR